VLFLYVDVAAVHAASRFVGVCCVYMLQILSAITENILEQVVCVSSIIEHFEFIRHYFESRGV